MSDNQGAGNTIAFTDEHIEAIKKGDKTSTLRTIKKDNFFEEGATAQIKDAELEIGIYDRTIVKIGQVPRFVDPDVGCFIDSRELADSEGFEDAEKLLEWFKNKNYNLPQNFFRYRFYVLNLGTASEDQQSLDEAVK